MSSIYELLWVEKYRPKTLNEIINQEEVVSRLKKFVEMKNMPHLLFAGPAGTGKTTAAHALAHDLYGENYRQYMLELNASVSKDTPILVRKNGRVMRIKFEDLDKMYFKDADSVIKYGDGEYVNIDDLEVLTVNKTTGKVEWRKATWLIRHKVSKILRVKVKGGGVIELTGNHSVMVISEDGELIEKSAKDLKPGDYLISFVSELEGESKEIKLDIKLNSSRIKTPSSIKVTPELAWLLGLYVAEGAVAFRKSRSGLLTSGQLVLTLSYPKELDTVQRVVDVASRINIPIYENLAYSGFDRSRASAIQIRLLSTGLSRFVKETAYAGNGTTAKNKRVPNIIYEVPVQQRIEFLKGLHQGDGTGKWGEVSRITSISKELLIDIAWLARISGIESSLYDREVRLIWKGSMKYKKSDLIEATPFIKFFEEISHAIRINWRYELRHQLYDGKETVSKQKLLEILNAVDDAQLTESQKEKLETLRRLASSDLHVIKIVSIELIDYNDYVYDVSVPGNNMFFAGSIPILLHNSDERGIGVIREKVKEFARSRTPPDIPFKIVLLDEADNMTADAQQALRRLMELYSANTRFILIANYPSKIIDPIQSRCAFFRFQPLKNEDVVNRLRFIAENEGVDYDEEALETIYEISEGDMRKAINVLQASAALGKVTIDAVFRVVGLAKPKEVREMIKLALKGDFVAARSLMRKLMIEYGLSGEDLIKQVHREIMSNEIKISEEARVLIADYIGEIHFRLVEGSDDDIQLSAFLAWLSMIGARLGVES